MRLEHYPSRFWLDTVEYKSSKQNKKIIEKKAPFSEELEDLVLTFLGQPHLARHKKFNLLQVNFEDFWGKGSNKVLSKARVLFLEDRRKLRWVPVTKGRTFRLSIEKK
jgi:hypothetical protein